MSIPPADQQTVYTKNPAHPPVNGIYLYYKAILHHLHTGNAALPTDCYTTQSSYPASLECKVIPALPAAISLALPVRHAE